MPTITLTPQQWEKVKNDADRQIQMLTDQEVEAIASKLNKKVNVPFLNENKEQVVLVKMVRKIDRYIYSILPNEYYELIRDASDGIDDDEADLLIQRIATSLNKHVDIPYVPEPLEQVIFETTVRLIMSAIRRGQKLAVN